MCLVPGYNFTKTLFLIWMMAPQTQGATIVYDKLLCPFLKEKEPFVDRKLQEAQEAAESAFSSFIRAWGQTIADQVVAIQKSDEFKQICLAIKALADQSENAVPCWNYHLNSPSLLELTHSSTKFP
ncbi:hypothetical protein DVH05_020379 [Phytophthora capsici]|nr:hypothetical protein DVH05_020379 [Phytophthora capsici]